MAVDQRTGIARYLPPLNVFVAGSFSGCCGNYVGYPLDTVRVLIQNSRTEVQGNALQVMLGPLRQVIQAEGIRGLFRGVLSPLVGAMTENAVAFGAQAEMKRLVCGRENVPDSELTLVQVFVAGGGTGFCVPFVTAPTELLKTVMQTDRSCGSYGQTMSKIIGARGVLGMTHGWMVTTVRELFFYSFFFGSYEATKRALGQGGDSSKVGPAGMLVAGGVAGCVGWLASYPLDCVKTRLQAYGLDPSPPKARAIVAQLWTEGGARGFYRGLSTTLIRAFPVNAVTFLSYELAVKFMDRIRGSA